MITYDGKNYVLKYNMKRIEMIEGVTNMPTLADLQRTRGMLCLASLKAYVAYGIKEDGSDVFLNPRKGMEIAESLIETTGYTDVCAIVLEALERDCPFFFPED